MIGIALIAIGFVVAYAVGSYWWAIAIANAWALGVMFNFKREERAPRWTGIAMPLSLAIIIKGLLMLITGQSRR